MRRKKMNSARCLRVRKKRWRCGVCALGLLIKPKYALVDTLCLDLDYGRRTIFAVVVFCGSASMELPQA